MKDRTFDRRRIFHAGYAEHIVFLIFPDAFTISNYHYLVIWAVVALDSLLIFLFGLDM